jgi:hypothetical protein
MECAIYPYKLTCRFGSEPVERKMETLILKDGLLDFSPLH